jgi:hypothetical protein
MRIVTSIPRCNVEAILLVEPEHRRRDLRAEIPDRQDDPRSVVEFERRQPVLVDRNRFGGGDGRDEPVTAISFIISDCQRESERLPWRNEG